MMSDSDAQAIWRVLFAHGLVEDRGDSTASDVHLWFTRKGQAWVNRVGRRRLETAFRGGPDALRKLISPKEV